MHPSVSLKLFYNLVSVLSFCYLIHSISTFRVSFVYVDDCGFLGCATFDFILSTVYLLWRRWMAISWERYFTDPKNILRL